MKANQVPQNKISGPRETISSKRCGNSLARKTPYSELNNLHRSIGNRAVQNLFATGLIQTKLKISTPNDKYEQEANRVADQVLRMEKPDVRTRTSEGELIQAKAATNTTRNLNTGITTQIPGINGRGHPLPHSLRSFMEPRFAHDFSKVRIHADHRANDLARDMHARAFTLGHDVVFGTGQYSPDTISGRKLLAHELTHIVQQNGRSSRGQNRPLSPYPGITTGAGGTVQREVEPEGISSANRVLSIIKGIGGSDLSETTSNDKVAEIGSKIASKAIANNMARLVALSKKFNPGAPGQAGPTNAFVYTCHCGWIDLGHFFISAAGAFVAAYAQQLAIRVEGKPYTQGKLFALWLDQLTPWLKPLLDTVAPGGRGKVILDQQRKLFESGEPRDISLAFGGYSTEYYQQLGKLFADPMAAVPKWLEGEQRSAFTTEDFPSDCYGAAFGQMLWNKVSHIQKGLDLSPIHDLMTAFFKECGAVFPEGQTRCKMMAETTPGSCRLEGNQPKWSKDRGTPRQHTSTTPYLLNSAEPLCGKNPKVLPCQSGASPSATPMPKAELDLSRKNSSAKLTLFNDITLHQPEERGIFGGEFNVPGRPERIDRKDPLVLGGPSILQINTKGEVIGYSTLRGVPGLGDTRLLGQLNLGTGRIWAQASGSSLDAEVTGKLHIDYDGLLKELVDLASPEASRFRQVLMSKEFVMLLRKVVGREIKLDEFYTEAKVLLQSRFPEGSKTVITSLLKRLIRQLQDELLPLYIGVKGHGTLNAFGVLPISYLTISKGTGRMSPLWGTELGLLGSELLNKRAVAGAKAWLYGEKILQAHATAGLDLLSKKWFAEIYAENKTLTGMDLNVRLRYEDDPNSKESSVFLTIGGQHEIWDSK